MYSLLTSSNLRFTGKADRHNNWICAQVTCDEYNLPACLFKHVWHTFRQNNLQFVMIYYYITPQKITIECQTMHMRTLPGFRPCVLWKSASHCFSFCFSFWATSYRSCDWFSFAMPCSHLTENSVALVHVLLWQYKKSRIEGNTKKLLHVLVMTRYRYRYTYWPFVDLDIQWNLSIKTIIGTNKMWSLYTGGLYMQVQ